MPFIFNNWSPSDNDLYYDEFDLMPRMPGMSTMMEAAQMARNFDRTMSTMKDMVKMPAAIMMDVKENEKEFVYDIYQSIYTPFFYPTQFLNIITYLTHFSISVHADIPGMTKEDIKVSADKNQGILSININSSISFFINSPIYLSIYLVLTISCERDVNKSDEAEGKEVIHRERYHGKM